MKVVDTELGKPEFITVMKSAHSDFIEHVRKVKEQYMYSAIKEMKEKLPEKHAIIQMDLAENYGCASVEEITSAYWNATMVTLRPAIAYYKAKDETLHHISTTLQEMCCGFLLSREMWYRKSVLPGTGAG